MEKAGKKIVSSINEFLTMVALSLLPPLAVYLDVVVVGHGVPEASITEYIQETLLLASAAAFWFCAWRNPRARGFIVLVAAFLSCLLIRELDGLFDAVWEGFWFWPALFLATTSLCYVALNCRHSVLEPMGRFVDARAYYPLIIGLLTVLVFSRVFGSGNLLWKHIVDDYTHIYKSALQEGLELYGYVFIAYGAWLFLQAQQRVAFGVYGEDSQPHARYEDLPEQEGHMARR